MEEFENSKIEKFENRKLKNWQIVNMKLGK